MAGKPYVDSPTHKYEMLVHHMADLRIMTGIIETLTQCYEGRLVNMARGKDDKELDAFAYQLLMRIQTKAASLRQAYQRAEGRRK